MHRLLGYVVLAIGAGGLLTSSASAQRHVEHYPSVAVDLVDCDYESQVRHLVSVELNAYVRSKAELPANVTRALVQCDEFNAAIEVTDPLTMKTVSRVVALDPPEPIARATLLAHAIAELVGASWLELAYRPELSSSTEPGAAKKQRVLARDAVRERENDWKWSTGLGPGLFGSIDPVVILGPALQLVARSPSDALQLQFDMFGGYGSRRHEHGDVSASVLSSAALLLFDIALPSDVMNIQLGAGTRFGATRIANEADDGEPTADTRDVSGMFGGLTLGLGASRDLGRWGSIRLMHQTYMGTAIIMRQDGEILQSIGGISYLWTLTLHLAM